DDQTLRVLPERLQIDAWPIRHTPEIALTRQPHEVSVPLLRLRQNRQMEVVARVLRWIVHAARRDVKLTPHDWLNPDLLRSLNELNRSSNPTMVRNGDSRLPILRHLLDDLFDPSGSIQERKLGMDVQ